MSSDAIGVAPSAWWSSPSRIASARAAPPTSLPPARQARAAAIASALFRVGSSAAPRQALQRRGGDGGIAQPRAREQQAQKRPGVCGLDDQGLAVARHRLGVSTQAILAEPPPLDEQVGAHRRCRRRRGRVGRRELLPVIRLRKRWLCKPCLREPARQRPQRRGQPRVRGERPPRHREPLLRALGQTGPLGEHDGLSGRRGGRLGLTVVERPLGGEIERGRFDHRLPGLDDVGEDVGGDVGRSTGEQSGRALGHGLGNAFGVAPTHEHVFERVVERVVEGFVEAVTDAFGDSLGDSLVESFGHHLVGRRRRLDHAQVPSRRWRRRPVNLELDLYQLLLVAVVWSLCHGGA